MLALGLLNCFASRFDLLNLFVPVQEKKSVFFGVLQQLVYFAFDGVELELGINKGLTLVLYLMDETNYLLSSSSCLIFASS